MDKYLSQQGKEKKARCEKFMDEINPTVSISFWLYLLPDFSYTSLLSQATSHIT